MEIIEKLQRVHEHVKKHPKDYQSVVAELMIRSDYIEHELHAEEHARLKRVAEIRARRKKYAEQNERNRNGRGHATKHSTTGGNGDTLSDAIQQSESGTGKRNSGRRKSGRTKQTDGKDGQVSKRNKRGSRSKKKNDEETV